MLGLLLAVHGNVIAQEKPSSESTVGVRAALKQIIIPGPEVEVVPIENTAAPLVIRITETYPGTEFRRYDLEYYGLEPGTYNVMDYLQRKDGSPLSGVPALYVKVGAVLPPGQILPHDLESTKMPEIGGYRRMRNFAIALWGVGLLAILFWRRPRPASETGKAAQPVVSFADQLRPLVEQARRGKLGDSDRARLERMLLGFWRRKLELQSIDPMDAMARLRQHPDAGPLIKKLEEWLHRPPGSTDEVDVASLLEPYENVTEQPA